MENETIIIGRQCIRTSKMAFEGLKLQCPNTTVFILSWDVNFFVVCWFLSSYFAINYHAPSPGKIDTILTRIKNTIQSYRVWWLLVSDNTSIAQGFAAVSDVTKFCSKNWIYHIYLSVLLCSSIHILNLLMLSLFYERSGFDIWQMCSDPYLSS